ncbi:MAG: Gfo/Idh/MocA family oxidoreductase [Ruminococcaceae bacterium]|nr:Gfo/Idh/MocA family oxidoreductase [Oscillospiraceae bacterium]
MKTIRIGIFGLQRGASFIDNILANNGEIVAVCDKYPQFVDAAVKKLGGTAKGFADFDAFIEEPMDAVLIANYFHEHAPYAIRALEKGIHVLSECISNGTMAEGVALVRAAKKSSAFYMLAENYPFMLFNQEIRRICKGGTLGDIMFGEGEYNHPSPGLPEQAADLCDGINHWRKWLPATYYITHSLAPLCYATGALPVRVTAMPIRAPYPEDSAVVKFTNDRTAVIMTQNDDGSVYRVTGCASFGAHGNTYRICGTNGQVENIRGTDGKVMLRYNEWQIPEGREAVNFYHPELIDDDAELIRKAGHGGGDFFVIRKFFEAIRTDTKPEMDELFGTRLSSAAILSHRSLMAGGAPYDLPDFSLESDCKKYENDRISPFWLSDGTAPNYPCSSHPEDKPSQYAIDNLKKQLERRFGKSE